MDKELIKIVKKIEGTLLGIGIENEKVLEEINKNNKIVNCLLLENIKKKGSSKLKFRGRHKKVNIKKLKKKFKKKQMDFVICNYNYISKFTKHFVPSSIYIGKSKLYIYGDINEEEKEEIIKKYKRYTSNIKVNNNIIEINMENTKNKFFKDKIYFIGDTLNNLLDLITNILIN